MFKSDLIRLIPITLLGFIWRLYWSLQGVHRRPGGFGLDVSQNSDDSHHYLLLARNLRFHHVFSDTPNLAPSYYRAPGYPAFISLLWWGGPEDLPVTAVLVANAVLGALTVVLVYLIARRFSARVAVLASVGMTFAPFSAFYGGEIMTETLYTFLTALACYFWAEDRLKLSGVVFGLSALVKLTALPFLCVLLAIGVLYRPQRKLLTIALFGLLAISPWTLRNYYLFGHFVPVATAGKGMQILLGTYDLKYGENVWTQLNAMPELRDTGYEWLDPRIEDVFFQRGVEKIKAAPLRWILIRAKQYPRLWIDLGAYLHPRNYYGTVIVKYLFLVGNLLLLALATLGAYLNRKPYLWLLPLFIALFHIPVWYDTRFSLPVVPMLAILAAISLDRIASLWLPNRPTI